VCVSCAELRLVVVFCRFKVKDGVVVVVFFFASGLPPPFPWGRLGAPAGRPPPPPPPPPFAGTTDPPASDLAASEDPVFLERGLR